MKLMSIYVAGFGCLRDADFDLNKEITVLTEDNGFGKSTLAAFIRVMLFGFEGEKSRNELEKERARFAPWGGAEIQHSLSRQGGIRPIDPFPRSRPQQERRGSPWRRP